MSQPETHEATFKLHNIAVDTADRRILDLPELTITGGEPVALLGDNGAGKSTLLNLLAGITSPTEGEILCLQQRLQRPLSGMLRRQIGYVAQQPYLLRGTVADNIQLGLRLQGVPRAEFESRTAAALEKVSLHSFADEAIDTLSGGELKRAAIARSIAHQPTILLLDEPFAALDNAAIKQLTQVIRQFSDNPKHTVIFSAHDQYHALSLATEVIYLHQGKRAPAPQLNLFAGTHRGSVFHTQYLQIELPRDTPMATHIAIDPKEIVIATHPIDSSMRNQFQGRLISIAEQQQWVRLTIDCGDIFHALISPQSLEVLALSLGDTLWVHFKSVAVLTY